jgi:hypothetical protein
LACTFPIATAIKRQEVDEKMITIVNAPHFPFIPYSTVSRFDLSSVYETRAKLQPMEMATTAVASRSNGKNRFHEYCSYNSVYCLYTTHLDSGHCSYDSVHCSYARPKRELLRVHNKRTQKIKVSLFSF